MLALTDGEDTFSQSADARLGDRRRPRGSACRSTRSASGPRTRSRATPPHGWPPRPAASTTRPAQADQLRTIYEELAERLRSSYSLAYRTDRRLPDGTLRPVRVAYRAKAARAAETAVFIPGMVVPAAGWSRLFLALLVGLGLLALLPGQLRNRSRLGAEPRRPRLAGLRRVDRPG